MAPSRSDLDGLSSWLFERLPVAVPEWITSQRWFAGKARRITRVAVEDLIWMSEGPPRALVIATVQYDGSDRAGAERYVFGISVVAEPHGRPILSNGDQQFVVEAVDDPGAIQALLGCLSASADLRGLGGGRAVFGDVSPRARRLIDASGQALPVVRLTGEQSNSSMRLGGALVLKLFRRLDEGENPEVEVCRFLSAHTAFRAAPSLEGSVTYVAADRLSTLAVIQGWIDNLGDGWRYTVRELQRAAGDPRAEDRLAAEMARLGEITAELHAALASKATDPEFAPDLIAAKDLGLWTHGLLDRIDRVERLITGARHAWTPDAAAAAEAVLSAGAALRARASLSAGPLGSIRKIRVHGDFHLGQTLKTSDGFALIDFEGEPARSLQDRRQKQCVLKDVAGMLRSFDYAVETVRRADPDAEPRSAAWLRGPFIAGYLSRLASAPVRLVPATDDMIHAWLDFFELEKALYEVEYEANNRPDWIGIPLGALRRLASAST